MPAPIDSPEEGGDLGRKGPGLVAAEKAGLGGLTSQTHALPTQMKVLVAGTCTNMKSPGTMNRVEGAVGVDDD